MSEENKWNTKVYTENRIVKLNFILNHQIGSNKIIYKYMYIKEF